MLRQRGAVGCMVVVVVVVCECNDWPVCTVLALVLLYCHCDLRSLRGCRLIGYSSQRGFNASQAQVRKKAEAKISPEPSKKVPKDESN